MTLSKKKPNQTTFFRFIPEAFPLKNKEVDTNTKAN